MRIGFIGGVKMSAALLRAVARIQAIDIVGVVTRSPGVQESDAYSLAPLATSLGIPVFLADTAADRDNIASWISSKSPDVLYCFGWSHLLPVSVLSAPPLGTIGFHPTMLPRNRGRHPIIWALCLGLTETGATFFFMNDRPDAGPIVSQVAIPISDDDDAWTLYSRIEETAVAQIRTFTSRDYLKRHHRTPQDESQASYWRKRCKADGAIDWRMGAVSLCNLVRALTRPYPGAHCTIAGADGKIWRLRPNIGAGPDNAEPGRVLCHQGGLITVKCGDGTVTLLDYEFSTLPDVGDYLQSGSRG